MPRVIHFEIYTDDPEAVQPFYRDVFGWTFRKFDGPMEYWLVRTGDDRDPGIDGGLTRPRPGQSRGTLNTIAVESLDQSIRKVKQSGGKVCVRRWRFQRSDGWSTRRIRKVMFLGLSSLMRTRSRQDHLRSYRDESAANLGCAALRETVLFVRATSAQ